VRARPSSVAVGRAVALALGLLVAACAPGTAPTPGPIQTGAIASPVSGSPAPVTSPVIGVPIDIEAEGFTKVTAFTIRTDDGRQLRFVMGQLENGAEFPPNHLAEHLAGSTKIRVFYRQQGADQLAYRLEDVLTP
jgi:hypothetical protein